MPLTNMTNLDRCSMYLNFPDDIFAWKKSKGVKFAIVMPQVGLEPMTICFLHDALTN